MCCGREISSSELLTHPSHKKLARFQSGGINGTNRAVLGCTSQKGWRVLIPRMKQLRIRSLLSLITTADNQKSYRIVSEISLDSLRPENETRNILFVCAFLFSLSDKLFLYPLQSVGSFFFVGLHHSAFGNLGIMNNPDD